MEENGVELLDAESLAFIFAGVSGADGVYLSLSWGVQSVVKAVRCQSLQSQHPEVFSLLKQFPGLFLR